MKNLFITFPTMIMAVIIIALTNDLTTHRAVMVLFLFHFFATLTIILKNTKNV
jgi:hypothetical protein